MAFPQSFAQSGAASETSAYETASHDLARSIDNLKDLVSNLEHRLQDVLVPADVKAAAEGVACSQNRAERAPLITMLEQHTARAESIAGDVSSLLRRLCL